MLSTMRSSWLLFALLALVALSTAFSVEEGINAYFHHGVKRQAEGTGPSTSEPAAPSTSDEPSPEPSSADEPSSTPDSEPTSAPPPASTTSSRPSPNDPSTSAGPTPGPSTPNQRSSTTSSRTSAAAPPSRTSASAEETPIVTEVPQISTEVQQSTVIRTITSDGSTFEQTSVTSRTVEHTTAMTTETRLPNAGNDDDGGDGLSSEKKAIIGGVIGGVGGAILLGGIAIVCWRMWGKKKRVSEDDADLMAGTGAALGDKSSTTSPFQSNLEQYHNPGGRPNAAANF